MIKINDKEIEIYYPLQKESSFSVIVLNTYGKEGDKIWKLTNKKFILVTISNIDWDKEMTPRSSPNIRKKNLLFKEKQMII